MSNTQAAVEYVDNSKEARYSLPLPSLPFKLSFRCWIGGTGLNADCCLLIAFPGNKHTAQIIFDCSDMSCDIRIGTSGFHYRHWVGPFYPPKTPAGKMLEYYTQQFDTLELNNSFYRLPTIEAFETWRDSTPKGFVFAVKASRFITHNKKLKDPENAIENLLPRAEHLGKKLGPILFQLPPKWKVNTDRLHNLLEILPREHRYAFEFRELSWLTPEVSSILRKFNAAFCIYELAGYHSPLEITADFSYIRLHGPTNGKYQGSYSQHRLQEWARWIEEHAKSLKAIYVYFDNDQAGYAAQNALTLRRIVSGGEALRTPRAA